MKTMQDSITVADLQLAAQNGDPVPDAFGGYDDGIYANSTQIKAIYPNIPVLAITVFASDNEGDCLDVENGDATPAEAPGWVTNRRNAGHTWPTVYCSEAIEQAVRDAFTAANVALPWLWLAAHPGEGAVVPDRPNVVGHQWVDRGPYDESVFLDTYPLFGAPTPPNPGPPTGENVSNPIRWDSQFRVFSAPPSKADPTQGELRHDWYTTPTVPPTPGQGWAHESLGSNLIPNQSVLVGIDNGQLHLFADLTDGRKLHRWSNPGTGKWGEEIFDALP